MHKLVRGAIAGAVATIPMTLIMTRLFRQLPPDQRYPLPPRLITESIAERAGVNPASSDDALTRGTLIAHFGYGAATGALFPLLEQRGYPPALAGPGYGLGVWAASYLGWIPALKILSPATRHPPSVGAQRTDVDRSCCMGCGIGRRQCVALPGRQ